MKHFVSRIILSVFILIICISAQPKREFRATWISTVSRLDWPTSTIVSNQKSQLISIFDELEEVNMNAAIFQVRPACDVFYDSEIEPWSNWLTGTEGQSPNPYYDPLEFAIEEAHKRNIELHAWFNPYRAKNGSSNGVTSEHVFVKHPEWILAVGSSGKVNPDIMSYSGLDKWGQERNNTAINYILNPGMAEVREYVLSVIMEVVNKYDIDGIHMDDYFYPYEGMNNEDQSTFLAEGRGFSNIADWRRDNINILLKAINDSINIVKPHVKFGMSPFGIWKNGVPSGIVGLDAYNKIYCDGVAWLDNQYIDYISPQLYWEFGGGQDYGKLMPWWAEQVKRNNRHLYTGNGPYRIIKDNWDENELPNQIKLNRTTDECYGNIYFRFTIGILNNPKGFLDTLKTNYYKYSALPPTMPWKDSIPPNVPQNVKYTKNANDYILSWQKPEIASDEETANKYVLYKSYTNPIDTDNPQNIHSILDSSITGITITDIPNTHFVLTALDRLNNESATVQVSEDVVEKLVDFYDRPYNLQLYTRDNSDSATVIISGNVITTGYDSLMVTVIKNESETKIYKTNLIYSGNQAAFSISHKIHAELSEHEFIIELINEQGHVLIETIEDVICGDAFIINGQSNSHFVLNEATFQNKYCRTFGTKTPNSNYDTYFAHDTTWAYSHGNVATGASVGVLGLYIQRLILEENEIPTCFINGGTGGSMIAEHLPDSTDRMNLNTIYGKLLYRITKGKINKIKGIIWYQGENDSDEDNTLVYPQRFQQLYDNWKLDYNPEKIYLFQLHPGNGGDAQGKFREMQRTLSDSLHLEDLCIMSTVGLPDYDGSNFSIEGYESMSERIFNVINHDFYGSSDISEIYPPNIRKIEYHKENQEMVLIFDNTESLVWPEDISNYKMVDYFFGDDDFGVIKSGRANNDSIILTLNGPNFFDKITYLPDGMYNSTEKFYNGPFIKNSRNISALTFHGFYVENPDSIIKIVSPNGDEILDINSEQTIEWINDNVNTIKIEYSPNNGTDWYLIAKDIDANQNPEIISEEYKIRISDMTDSTIADESNRVFTIKLITEIEISDYEIPKQFTLMQNYPNPFNPTTIIKYEIPKSTHVILTVYNLYGQEISRLVDQNQNPGFYSVKWDASSNSSGVYFYKISADGFLDVKKSLLIK